jgi:hypothetical protein
VYCKFLLQRSNFSIPVTHEEVASISLDDFHHDDFTTLPKLPVLSKLLNEEIQVKEHGAASGAAGNHRRVPEEVREIIERYNAHDIYLLAKIASQ